MSVPNGRSALFERMRLPTFVARSAGIAGAVLLSLVAIVFARTGEAAQNLFLRLYAAAPWAAAMLTPAMFVLVVWATRRFFPEARGSGIPQVMAAARQPERSANGPLISLRTAAAKFLGTCGMLIAGGSAGREGPTVQISAALMVAVHRWLRVPVSAGVVIAGGAAGVAAAFNTPLAGVAFAIEELAAAFEQKVAVIVMATVMVAGLVSLGIDGDYVYFGATTQALPLGTLIIAAPLAGVLGGASGGLFARAVIAAGASPRRLPQWLRAHPLTMAALCGIVVAGCGLASAGLSWGTGYATTRSLLEGHAAPLSFGPWKFVASLATALSGAPGGIFAPSLSVGAGVGQLTALAFPHSSAGAIVLLGMIGYFTGVVRAPLTAAIIMMEMTNDRTMILPLFAAALIADWVSARVCPHKLYHALSAQFERV